MAISGFPPNQPVSLYEAALANGVIIMRRLNRGDYSGLAEYIAFSARPWEKGHLSALASNRSIRRKERARDPFELRGATNKLCLAQMGEKGRADCHLSGTLKWQSIKLQQQSIVRKSANCEFFLWFPTEINLVHTFYVFNFNCRHFTLKLSLIIICVESEREQASL